MQPLLDSSIISLISCSMSSTSSSSLPSNVQRFECSITSILSTVELSSIIPVKSWMSLTSDSIVSLYFFMFVVVFGWLVAVGWLDAIYCFQIATPIFVIWFDSILVAVGFEVCQFGFFLVFPETKCGFMVVFFNAYVFAINCHGVSCLVGCGCGCSRWWFKDRLNVDIWLALNQ